MKRLLTFGPIILAVVGLGLSSYLTWVHYHPGALVCGNGGCEIVQATRYSKIGDIPIALLGLLMFTTTIALMIIRQLWSQFEDAANAIILAMLVGSVLYFVYLTWLEATEIHAWCQWCVTTSIVTLALLILEGIRYFRSYNEV